MLRCPKPWPWFMLGIVGKHPMISHTMRCFVMFRAETCRARVTLNNFVIEMVETKNHQTLERLLPNTQKSL